MEKEPAGLPSSSSSSAPPATPTEVPRSIHPIEEASRKRIVAGQAVFDLSSAVKELVDNAIDAQSKNINIRLFDQGLNIVEVSDDGVGVPPESRPYMALPHSTSKIKTFDDIYSSDHTTLGFRGEALFCLANLSRELVVATRTAQESLATKMSFARDGTLKPDSIEQRPKKVGTTVAVVGLLEAVPVRRADLMRRIAEQRRKLVRLISGYAVCTHGVGFRLLDISTAASTTSSRQPQTRELELLATPAHCQTLPDTISAVFGFKFWKSLVEFEIDLTDFFNNSNNEDNQEDDEDDKNNEDGKQRAQPVTNDSSSTSGPGPWKVTGFVSKFGAGTKERLRDEQLYSINQRPVDMPRFSRMFNEVWRSLCGPLLLQSNKSHHPSCILQFTFPNRAYDINVSPDKREVIMPKETELLDLVQSRVAQLWSSHIDGQFSAAPELHERDQQPPPPSRRHGLEEENEGPSKFNRRYAFSHDVSKIRLQHQYDDGRRPSPARASRMAASANTAHQEEEEGEQAEEMQEGKDEESVEENQDTEEAATKPESPGNSPHLPEKRAASLDVPSPAEDRLWRAAKRRLHESSATETRQEQDSFLNKFRAPEPGPRNRKPSYFTPSSHCLERFGFQATQRAPSSGERQTPSSGERQLTQQQQHESPSKRVSFDSVATGDLSSGVASSGAVTPAQTAQLPLLSLEQSPRGKPPVLLTPQESEKESGSPEVTENDPPQPVVWSSLSDTDLVMGAARKERIAMRDRRISFQGAEAGPKKDPGEEEDDEGGEEPENKISLQKADFESMQIIGQFNMGFILARSSDNNLWIMDQHACDEKSNFEKLVAETVIQQQPLIAPMPLELSPSEETCVLDHLELFAKNGFRFLYKPENPPRQRLSLTSIPHSGAVDGRKAVQFGKDDVGAFCALLGADDNEAGTTVGSGTGADGSGMYGSNAVRRYGQKNVDDADRVIARLPKAIAMFASRACRSSIMIGTALSKEEMSRVVQKLAVVDHPWNCPHGRPTMQHAGRLGAVMSEDERRRGRHLAGPTTAIMTQEVEVNENDEALLEEDEE